MAASLGDDEAGSQRDQSASGSWLWSAIAVGVGFAGFVLLDEKKRRKGDDRDEATKALFDDGVDDGEDDPMRIPEEEIDELSILLAANQVAEPARAGASCNDCGRAVAIEAPVSCALLDRPVVLANVDSPIARAPRNTVELATGRKLAARANGKKAAKEPPRKSRNGRRWAWLAMCLFLAAVAGLRPIHTSTPAGKTPTDHRAQVVTKAIEDIQLGERVLGENPESSVEDRGAAEPDPATWRELHLRAPKVDGSWADVKLLRPVSWLEEQQAKVGGTVEIAVPECGIEGHAQVLAIGDCPPIMSGKGHVVTGTFRHGAVKTVDLKVQGLEHSIGCTPNHPFWSEDKQKFVRADALRPGERLHTLRGLAKVVAVVPRAGVESVFNIEVQRTHVYRVTDEGILVHNGSEFLCNLASQLQSLIRRQEAGFAGKGVPLIIDANSERAGMAAALRARGYNVRTVSEIFGKDPGDPAIQQLAEDIGGRVLTNNMKDFGRLIGIKIDPRAISVETWIRLIEAGLP
jgi:hypothetical protein